MNFDRDRSSGHAAARKRPLALFGLVCVLVMGGCGEEVPKDRLAVYPASGKVTVKGRPAGGVFVVLHPNPGSPAEKGGVFPSAHTQEDGTFRLTTYEQNDGAPAGSYAVTIRWYHKRSPSPEGRPTAPFARPVDSFGGKYHHPQTSPWHVTITEGKNVLQPIEVP